MTLWTATHFWTVRQFRSDSWDARCRAVAKLSGSTNQSAVRLLVDALADQVVRRQAAAALTGIGWRPTNLEDEVRFLIAQAAWDGLEEFGRRDPIALLESEAFHRELHDKYSRDRRCLVRVCGALRSERAAAMILSARSRSHPAYDIPYQSYIDALVGIGEIGCPALIRALDDGDGSEPRWTAIAVLGELRAVEAVDPLLRLLANCRQDWRDENILIGHIVRALGRIGDARAIDPLLARLEASEWSRFELGEALFLLGERNRSIDALITRMCPPAIRLLGLSGDLRAVDPIIDALDYRGDRWDAGHNVRAAAAEALGNLADSRAVRPLVRAALDDSPEVRAAVARALKVFKAEYEEGQCFMSDTASHDWVKDSSKTETEYERHPVSKDHIVRDYSTYYYQCSHCECERSESVTSEWVQ